MLLLSALTCCALAVSCASKKFRKAAMNYKQRKDRIRQKIAAFEASNCL
jgi:hypothetical protein